MNMELKIKPCIGMISYLPDDPDMRKERIRRLDRLVDQINRHFDLSTIIIAQNWKDYIAPIKRGIIISYDKPLGITKARIVLRSAFLQRAFTHIIMLDDDMIMSENQEDYDNYLYSISNNYDYYYVDNFLNNFSCLTRNGFMRVDYDPSIEAEKGTGFEDWVFHMKCKKVLNSAKIVSNLPAYPRKYFLNDKFSTWETDLDPDLKKKNDLVSREIIQKL